MASHTTAHPQEDKRAKDALLRHTTWNSALALMGLLKGLHAHGKCMQKRNALNQGTHAVLRTHALNELCCACFCEASAPPHGSGSPWLVSMFQVSLLSCTCLRLALATPHASGRPLLLHMFPDGFWYFTWFIQVSPGIACFWIATASPNGSNQPRQLHMFQVSLCNLRRFG